MFALTLPTLQAQSRVYGNAHAGKNVASSLQLHDNAMEGPSDGLGAMQGMRHYAHRPSDDRLGVGELRVIWSCLGSTLDPGYLVPGS